MAAFAEILASTWYPLASFHHFMRETERQLTEQEPAVSSWPARGTCADHTPPACTGGAVCRFEGDWDL